MNNDQIIKHRLVNQQIASTNFTSPNEIVEWFGAMQAQEYAMAKWALGLRLPGTADTDIEASFNNGEILRTHALRPTWHFVTPENIRLVQSATAHRVHAFNAYYNKKLELDKKNLTRACNLITKTLEGGKYLTTTELQEVLAKGKIIADKQRLAYIKMFAELECLICSGPRRGKQFTYALLDERASACKHLNREESITELTRIYFTSRGPAGIKDFAWWSSLTVKEIQNAINDLGNYLISEKIDGCLYYFTSSGMSEAKIKLPTFLMPDYDEYGISYKDRSLIFVEAKKNSKGNFDGSWLIDEKFRHMIITDGIIGGAWSRVAKESNVEIETVIFPPAIKKKERAVKKAVKEYLKFFKGSA